MKWLVFAFLLMYPFISTISQCDSTSLQIQLREHQYDLLIDYSEKLQLLKESVKQFSECKQLEAAFDWQVSVIRLAKNENDPNEQLLAIRKLDHLIIDFQDSLSRESKINLDLRSSFYWFELYFKSGYYTKAQLYLSLFESKYQEDIESLQISTKSLIVSGLTKVWNYHFIRNDFQLSLNYLDKAHLVTKLMAESEMRLYNECYIIGKYSLVYLEIKEQKKAREYCKQHLIKAKKLIKYSSKYRGHLYTANSRMAEWHINNNSLDSALYYSDEYASALKKYKSSPFFSDIMRANIFIHKNDFLKSNYILRKLIDYEGGIDEMIDNRSLMNCLEILDLLIQSEDFEVALALQDSIDTYLRNRIHLLKKLDVPIYTSNERYLLNLKMSKLRLPAKYLDLDAQLRISEEAFALINDGLLGISNKQDKLLFSRNSALLTEDLLNAMTLDDSEYRELEFSFIEKSKAATLINSWKQKQLISFLEKEDIFSKESELENDLELLSINILEESDSSALISLKKIIKLKNDELAFTKQELKSSHLTYYKMKYDWQNPSIQDLQSILKDDDVYINYFQGEHSLFAMLISSNTSKIIKIDSIDVVNDLITQYSHALLKPFDAKAAKVLDNISYSLYHYLIEPFAEDLAYNIIISPSGSLSQIPFSALRQNKDPGIDAMLIAHHAISYTPSSSLFYQERTSKNDQKVRNALLIAPEFAEQEKNKELLAMRSSMGELVFNVDEVESIATLVKSNLLSREKATKQAFLDNLINADLLHFATHAKSNEDAPDKSFIAFYNENAEGNDSSLLYLDELSKLHIPAKMVVLSACETGLGKIYKGEGAMSLANACFYGGAHSVVASLWSVLDDATFEIMKSFYQYLDDGLAKDKAMQSAKLDFLHTNGNNFHHPFYWAGFTVIGNTSELQFTKDVTVRNWIVSISAILMLMIAVFYFHRSRNIS